MTVPSVTIIVLTWNSRQDIDTCLTSMLRQTYDNYSIMVVDSCSTDGTADYVRAHYPRVSVTELEANLGYRRGNAVGMAMADSDLIVVCNDDVEVEANWLSAMVDVISDENVGMVTPLILMDQKRDVVNSAGNTLHFSGMTGPRGKGDSRNQHATRTSVSAVSGCCFMIRRQLLHKLGGFSPDFDEYDVGWHASFEDVDLVWRTQMAGYRIEYVPDAVMYHKYKQPALFPARFGAYELGRYLVILRNYRLMTLMCLMPFLLILDILAWSYACSRGKAHVMAKAGVMKWLILHPHDIVSMRERVQKMRVKSDYEILGMMTSELSIAKPLGDNIAARFIDKGFSLFARGYYKVLLLLVRVFSRK